MIGYKRLLRANTIDLRSQTCQGGQPLRAASHPTLQPIVSSLNIAGDSYISLTATTALFCNYKRLSNENGIANRLGTWHGSPSTRTASHCILHSIPTGLQHLVDAPLSLTTTILHPTTLKGSRTKSSQWIVMKPTEDVHHIEDQQLEPSDRLRHASNASSSTPSHRQLRRAAAQPPVY